MDLGKEISEIKRKLKRAAGDDNKIMCLEGELDRLLKEKAAYRTIRVKGAVVKEHRHVAGVETGAPIDVHHRDGDTTNNTHTNLLPMSHKENCHLRTKRKNTSSQYIGVYWDKAKQCWRARIKLANGTTKHLGYFKVERDAAMAYDAAAVEAYGLANKTMNFYDANNIVELIRTVQLDTAYLFRQAAQGQLEAKRRALGAGTTVVPLVEEALGALA